MKEVVFIRLDEKIKAKLKKIAKEEHRSVSNLIGKIIFDWIKDREKAEK